MNDLRLTIELIPQSINNGSLLKRLSKRDWGIVKRKSQRDSNNTCANCGKNDEHSECHEIWDFNERKRKVTLTGVIPICADCHRVKHTYMARNNGKQDVVIDQLIKINGMMEEEALAYIEESINIWKKRSGKEWTADFSWVDVYLNEAKIYELVNGINMDRKDIYDAFDKEREYQDNKWGKDICSFPQIAIDIEEHLNRLKKNIYNLDDENAKNEMRKIGTLCIKYAENYGMPTRADERGEPIKKKSLFSR